MNQIQVAQRCMGPPSSPIQADFLLPGLKDLEGLESCTIRKMICKPFEKLCKKAFNRIICSLWTEVKK